MANRPALRPRASHCGERVAFVSTPAFGYAVMLVAMSFVFVGVKRYRDVEGGGVIRFGRALGLALLTAMEVAPVGLVVAIVSAALLRNPRIFSRARLAAPAHGVMPYAA